MGARAPGLVGVGVVDPDCDCGDPGPLSPSVSTLLSSSRSMTLESTAPLPSLSRSTALESVIMASAGAFGGAGLATGSLLPSSQIELRRNIRVSISAIEESN